MSNRTVSLDDALYHYLLGASLREHPALARLRAETATHPQVNMQIAPEQGQFMALLVRLMGASRCIEVGVFTGYSSLAVALALPPGGRIVACDVSDEYTAMARRYWAEAGVSDRIDLRLAPALETLDTLLAEGEAGTCDFAFIDADKEAYPDYYERLLQLLRPGGLIAVDNTLWDGAVADPANQAPDTVAIRAFNARLHGDERIDLSLVPIGDGLTLARKR
ncbi:class I SAM-dependent methyltransferase [Thioalkalivibrio sp. XN279]|uniref:class I SAM-dependent methyltransferase n=1 Tax=Thioalkalivibrio sp. XN279 TaxID=2714953 RepID=UPI00140E2CB3|nr:class I SAM-dependent methyltransferase [Thioalkalivibrio sp. XN279]NHA16115.1 SAM-dependent methyltransferase [Thioalkalivibrio sp. XN279]